MNQTYNFSVNNFSFFEAQTKNSCLNKKISIDLNGFLKNCPSFNYDFGHIDSIGDINSIIDNEKFTKIWNVNKDSISVCKDCEYRFICHDCRVFVQDQDDIFSKPAKCKYNPYEGIWEI